MMVEEVYGMAQSIVVYLDYSLYFFDMNKATVSGFVDLCFQ